MTPALSKPSDIPALRKLWTAAFGDGDDLLDPFFAHLYRPEDAFVVRAGGAARAMGFHLPMTICEGGRGWRAAYLYAAATEEGFQGRGLCSALLAYAEGVLAGRGYKAILLVPGEPDLRDFYRKRGYVDFSAVNRFELETAPAGGRAEPVDPPEYLELRESLLAGRAYVSCPVPVLGFQQTLAKLYGGGLYRLADGETEGCACAALDGTGRAVVYELLWPGDPKQGASLIARAVGTDRALVRAPGGEDPFAMARWLIEPPKLTNPYLGIALD